MLHPCNLDASLMNTIALVSTIRCGWISTHLYYFQKKKNQWEKSNSSDIKFRDSDYNLDLLLKFLFSLFVCLFSVTTIMKQLISSQQFFLEKRRKIQHNSRWGLMRTQIHQICPISFSLSSFLTTHHLQ